MRFLDDCVLLVQQISDLIVLVTNAAFNGHPTRIVAPENRCNEKQFCGRLYALNIRELLVIFIRLDFLPKEQQFTLNFVF